MPQKKKQQPQQYGPTEKEGATGGAIEENFLPTMDQTTSPEASFSSLAQMFETFMQFQMERDKRYGKETAKLE